MCKSIVLSSRLTELRKAKNITQEEVAAAMSVSNKTVSKWENGDSTPDLVMLAELAKYYGVSTDFLLGVKSKENQTLTEVIGSLLEGKSKCEAALTAFDIARAVIRMAYATGAAGQNDMFLIPENDSVAHRDCITGSDFHDFTVRSDNVNFAVMLLKNKADFAWMYGKEVQQKICSLFAFLSDPGAIKLCAFIHSKQCSESFTADHAAKYAEISTEEAVALLDAAVDIHLCKKNTAHIGASEIDVYKSRGDGNILTMICLAYEYMCGQQGYNYYTGGECRMIGGERK